VRKVKAEPENTINAILQAGQFVYGKYRVDRLIGQGGMAAVWAGTDERTGKRVALKVILRSLAKTTEAQALFYGEARAVSRVNHPNVVTVFDVIQLGGMPCIVMELLEGEPLGDYIAVREFLTVSEATTVLLPAMRGVAAAHAQGVIHCDLKPQNIFVCIGPDGRVVTTKVLDFGISVMVERATDRSAGPSPALSMGTPAYMSPEQLLGWARIDERADVYSFGVLLYEALTGEMPFSGQPGPELFHRIVNDAPPPVTLSHPELPPGLVGIIEKAMAKRPSDRYANLNLLLGSIEDALAPASPAPRLVTPIAGVPAHALRESSSGEEQAVLKQEQSGKFQDTQLFFSRPTEKDIPVVAADGPADERGLAAAAPPLPTDPEKGAWSPGTWPDEAPVSGRTTPFVFRHWRWFVGVGCTIVPIFAVWMMAARIANRPAMRNPSAPPEVPTVLPAATKPAVADLAVMPTATKPAVADPAVMPTATNPVVAVPDRLSPPPSSPQPSAHATAEHRESKHHVRKVPLGRHAERGASGPDAPPPTASSSEESAPPAPPASSSAKSKLPRAGGLSADEF
jgi:eukaryotic-like serine/threonine-protein kinase